MVEARAEPEVKRLAPRRYCAPLLVSADGAAFAGGVAVFATAGIAFFTTDPATLGGAAGFAASLPQELNKDDSGAFSLTPLA